MCSGHASNKKEAISNILKEEDPLYLESFKPHSITVNLNEI
jgi:hypothetical protein